VAGAEPQPGDSRDMLHCISASTADVFVTHDNKLRSKLDLFKVDNFKVCNFKEFVQILKQQRGNYV